MGILTRILGDESARSLKDYQPIVEQINRLEDETASLTNSELQAKTGEFRERVGNGETLDDLLPEAFAVVREAAKRTLGQRHYDVQLLGGIAIHKGNIAEMRTGEGKTLVSTLPAYLNALGGRGVHVVTVNDYLARRDAVWMGQIYSFLGVSVGVANSSNASYLYDQSYAPEGSEEDEERDEEGFFKVVYEYLKPVSRRAVYEADITYGTNSEFGFDYLRDHLVYQEKDVRQRGHVYAIVDEIDSILIDEARTPLIISGPALEAEDLYKTFADIARSLVEGEDYTVDEKHNAIQLTDAGIEKAERALGVENLYTDKGVKYVHHLETAVRARALYRRDKEYVMRDGNVVIIDQFTGRMMPTRRFSGGLHQAIEAKEGVEVRRESQTYASVTYQNYFRMYEKLSGMTGTAKTSEEEFQKVYNLSVVVVPTNKPIARVDLDDLIFQTETGKFKAIARKVKELNEKGQPVLIGTVSIEKNELLSNFLRDIGVPHEVLNAKQHEKEGEITARAGRKGAVTIATNMAGRGVDIKLGGENAVKEKYEEVKNLGGLFVLGTERHEARRIDDQLRGRSGRQGDPGETQFFVSLEDDLMRVFASQGVKNMMGRFGIPEDEAIQNRMITRALEQAQTRIEGIHFDARKNVLSYDDVLNKQRLSVYARRNSILQSDEALDEEILYFEGLGDEHAKTMEEKREILGEEDFRRVFKRIILQVIDMLWMEHLESMEYLRSSVSLRAYGQRDPLVEYKKEGLAMYHDMEARVDETVLKLIGSIDQAKFEAEKRRLAMVQAAAEKAGSGEDSGPAVSDLPTRGDGEKIGRNDWVVITNGTEEKKLKYKKAEPLLSAGWSIKSVE